MLQVQYFSLEEETIPHYYRVDPSEFVYESFAILMQDIARAAIIVTYNVSYKILNIVAKVGAVSIYTVVSLKIFLFAISKYSGHPIPEPIPPLPTPDPIPDPNPPDPNPNPPVSNHFEYNLLFLEYLSIQHRLDYLLGAVAIPLDAIYLAELTSIKDQLYFSQIPSFLLLDTCNIIGILESEYEYEGQQILEQPADHGTFSPNQRTQLWEIINKLSTIDKFRKTSLWGAAVTAFAASGLETVKAVGSSTNLLKGRKDRG